MKYIKKTLDFQIEEPTVVTLGKFDGLHRGHEKLMNALKEYSRLHELAAVAFTFDIPPRNRLEDITSKVLTTNEEKEYIFDTTGIDYLVECPFTTEVMSMEPKAFIAWIVKTLHMKCVVVGDDFHFGYKRTGDYHTLMQYEQEFGYQTIVVDKMKDNNRDISSTYVREEIAAGNLQKVYELLGYHYFIKSDVVHGKKLGRTIGVPTINMVLPTNKLLPPNGVYVTEVIVEDEKYIGVTNVGYKPTVSDSNMIGVETYIIDFNQTVYGDSIVISFLAYVRPEIKFHSVDELKNQMVLDIEFARKCYKDVT